MICFPGISHLNTGQAVEEERERKKEVIMQLGNKFWQMTLFECFTVAMSLPF